MATLIEAPEAANRLARAIASDLSLYNEAKIKEGIENDTFFTVLTEEIEEGRAHYESRGQGLPPAPRRRGDPGARPGAPAGRAGAGRLAVARAVPGRRSPGDRQAGRPRGPPGRGNRLGYGGARPLAPGPGPRRH